MISRSSGRRFGTTPIGSFAQTASRETVPSLAPLSQRLMGRIRNLAILPAPEWWTPLRGGVADPVRMKRPCPCFLSTCDRVASQMAGTICHSSIRRGSGPSNAYWMSISTRLRVAKLSAESPIGQMLAAWRMDVQVLPHHIGPSTHTAPKPERCSARSLSAIRGR